VKIRAVFSSELIVCRRSSASSPSNLAVITSAPAQCGLWYGSYYECTCTVWSLIWQLLQVRLQCGLWSGSYYECICTVWSLWPARPVSGPILWALAWSCDVNEKKLSRWWNILISTRDILERESHPSRHTSRYNCQSDNNQVLWIRVGRTWVFLCYPPR